MMILGSGVSGLINRLTEMNMETSKRYVYRASLNSFVAYTQVAIKQRWCLTATLSQDSPSTCNLAHPRSIERMLLNDTQLSYIRAMKAANPSMPYATPEVIPRIEVTVPVASFDQNHPLHELVAMPEMAFAGSVKFVIERINDPDWPVIGNEVNLRIQVEILPQAGQSTPGNRALTVQAGVTVFPRELGTFALIVAGDLRVDGSAPSGRGDVSLPIPTTGQGLVFESPVFVNYNIHIPPSDQASFPNVTFADTVIMGRGVLLQSGQPAQQPRTGGLEARLYSNAGGFGGFLRGIKVDDQLDLGLDVFSGRSAGSPPDDTLFQSCIDRNRTLYDLTATKDSRLVGRANGPGSWRLSWTQDNFFNDQRTNDGIEREQGQFQGNPSYNQNGSDHPVVRLTITFSSGQRVEAEMPRNATLRMRPRDGRRVGNPAGELVIETREVNFNNRNQDNQVDLNVRVNNEANFIPTFDIAILGYDVGYDRGTNRRGAPGTRDTWDNTVTLRYGNGAAPPLFVGSVNVAQGFPATFPAGIDPDWQATEVRCDPSSGDADAYAFMPSRWDISFAPSTRFSWNVRPPPAPGNLEFNAANSTASVTVSPSFITYSIANTCTIRADATFVTGMIACDRFVIEARTRPLRIIGSVLAANVQIDPSAVAAGIRWSTIFNADAVVELRNARVLRSQYAANQPSCDPTLNEPIWHPSATLQMRDDRYHCSPISLRDKLDPFRWTNVDPDCGLISGAPTTTCKNRPVRYVIKEISKVFSL